VAKAKLRAVTSTLAGAIDVGELGSLRDELQEWLDSLPESLQGGSKADQLEEAISSLDSCEEIELPTELEHLENAEVTSIQNVARKLSRSARRDNVVSWLRAAQELLDERATSYHEYAELESTPSLGTPPDDHNGPWTQDDYTTAAEKALELVDEIETICDNVEAAEFPQMYG